MLESLSSKKLHPEPVEESDFMKLTTPYSFTFFVGIFIASFILSNVQQTNWTWKTPYCTLLTSLRSYLWGNLTTLHPGYSYILLVPLYFGSAVMFWVMQAELENLKFIAVLGIIHGALEDLVSYISCNLEKKISFFGKFSHSSPRETNGWYRYHKHVFWINWIVVRIPIHLLTKHFIVEASSEICYYYLSSAGYWMVFHRRILGHWDAFWLR